MKPLLLLFIPLIYALSCKPISQEETIINELNSVCKIHLTKEILKDGTSYYHTMLHDSIFLNVDGKIKDIIDRNLNVLHKTIKEFQFSYALRGNISSYEWETPKLNIKYENLVKNTDRKDDIKLWIRNK
jgi:hypothetical protein